MTTKRQLPLDLGYRPALGRDDFLVAPCNQDAVTFIDQWPDWKGHALCVFGPPGCGKSHLANVFALRANAEFVSPSDLCDETVEGFIKLDKPLVIEDGDLISESRALLHLFNATREQGHYLLFTSQKPPARWSTALPDLRSRMAALHAVRIDAPDDTLMGAILVKLFADRQISVSPEVISYAIRHMTRSYSAARRIVDLADKESLAGQKAVTVPLIKVVLNAATEE